VERVKAVLGIFREFVSESGLVDFSIPVHLFGYVMMALVLEHEGRWT
jgi:hypothetical protein